MEEDSIQTVVDSDERGGETGLRQPLKNRASPQLYKDPHSAAIGRRLHCCAGKCNVGW